MLKASDLAVVRRPKTEGRRITDMSAVVGLAARHPIAPGPAAAAADLMKPEIVQRNETVTIVYQAPGLMLTLRGQAQEAGALGDTIGVLNVAVQAHRAGRDFGARPRHRRRRDQPRRR